MTWRDPCQRASNPCRTTSNQLCAQQHAFFEGDDPDLRANWAIGTANSPGAIADTNATVRERVRRCGCNLAATLAAIRPFVRPSLRQDRSELDQRRSVISSASAHERAVAISVGLDSRVSCDRRPDDVSDRVKPRPRTRVSPRGMDRQTPQSACRFNARLRRAHRQLDEQSDVAPIAGSAWRSSQDRRGLARDYEVDVVALAADRP